MEKRGSSCVVSQPGGVCVTTEKKKVDGKTNRKEKKHPWAEAIYSTQAETTSRGSVLMQ